MITNLQGKKFKAYVQVYLIDQGKVLLIHRGPKARFWPNKLLGIGGNLEQNEDPFTGAIREFKEETNLQIQDLHLKGTFTWFDDTPYAGTNYIFTCDSFSGEQYASTEEGSLEWHTIDLLQKIPDLAYHTKYYLPYILQKDSFYSSLAIFEEGKIVEYIDNLGQTKELTQLDNDYIVK